jgi:hypothetical protein
MRQRIASIEGLTVMGLSYRPDLELWLAEPDSAIPEKTATILIGGAFEAQAWTGARVFRHEGQGATTALMDALSAYRFVYGSTLEEAWIEEDGRLSLRFAHGRLTAFPDTHTEAWEVRAGLNAVQGLLVVCMPGGGVAHWGLPEAAALSAHS